MTKGSHWEVRWGVPFEGASFGHRFLCRCRAAGCCSFFSRVPACSLLFVVCLKKSEEAVCFLLVCVFRPWYV